MYHLILIVTLAIIPPAGSGFGGIAETKLSLSFKDIDTCASQVANTILVANAKGGDITVVENCKYYPLKD